MTSGPTPPEFDFQYWARLAREDPRRFEDERARLIETFIESAPPDLQPRLRGLQWRTDQVRRRAGTPLAACIRLSGMMWDLVLGEGGFLAQIEALGRLGQPGPLRPVQLRAPGQVLTFRRRDHDQEG